jgi:hypothetical protein
MRFLVAHSLSLALAAVWLALLAACYATRDTVWLYDLIANHAGDTFGALLVVVATKFLFERGSAASKQPPDEEP